MKIELISRPKFLGIPAGVKFPQPHQMVGPHGQQLIEIAGRECYDSMGREKTRSSESYAEHIVEVGHGSVLEHSQYSFRISGVSRGLTHELVRHRAGTAFSQRSTRYVDELYSAWIEHPVITAYMSEAIESAIAKAETVGRQTYETIVNELIDQGVPRKQARGAARGYLGNCLETSLIFSANVRALQHIICMRATEAADAEIRRMAVRLFEIMRKELPCYFVGEVRESPDGIGNIVVGMRKA